MAVRSSHLGHVTTTTALQVLHTVPAGRTTIVKYITLMNPGVAGVFTSVVARYGGSDYRVIFETIPATSALRFTTFIVLEEGDTLECVSAVAGVEVAASGAVLLGVPS